MSAVFQFTTCSSLCSEEGVGDAGDLDHFGDVVDADNVLPPKMTSATVAALSRVRG